MRGSIHLNDLLDVTREAPACGRLRPPLRSALSTIILRSVEVNVRENPAIPGQLRSGVSPATVKAIYFSSLPLAMMPLSTLPLATLPLSTMPLTTLPLAHHDIGPSAMNRRHWR